MRHEQYPRCLFGGKLESERIETYRPKKSKCIYALQKWNVPIDGKTINLCLRSSNNFTFKTLTQVHNSLHLVHTLGKKTTFISNMFAVFLWPTPWTIYSFSAVCLCGLGHSKQINNHTERSDSASLSPPPSVLYCSLSGVIMQYRLLYFCVGITVHPLS